MRRAERLFQIIQALRGGRLTTARDLGRRLEVSERTIYRDIAHLMALGVPIDGAAGAGYILRDGFDIPPLMFSRQELEALVVGARMVQAWAGARFGRAATQALGKIEAVIPADLRRDMEGSRLFAPRFHTSGKTGDTIDLVHAAMAAKTRLFFHYVREDATPSARTVQPLGLFFWGQVWTLVAWCDLRDDFRTFRLDRMDRIEITQEPFQEQPGRSLQDYLNRMRGCAMA